MKKRNAEFDAQTYKLQVPMRRDTFEVLETHALETGFDSVQAYVRFWARSHARPSPVNSKYSKPEAQALQYLELLLALNPRRPTTTTQALDYLVKQWLRAKHKKSITEMILNNS